jgi:diaminopimelate epimerase
MRIFNADGSEATSCGSALRCVTAYLGNSLQKNRIVINTLSGLKFGTILKDESIKVNLGQPSLIQEKYKIGAIEGSLVQLGNSHFVVKTGSLPDSQELKSAFKICQNDHTLSNSNLEFYQIKSADEVEIKIWERGSGPTLACGTGAGAVVFSGLVSGLLRSPVKVIMPGGDVVVEFADPDIFLSGKVDFVFQGDIFI